MAVSELLPVRGLYRTQAVRVGVKRIVSNKTTYVNVARGDIRKGIAQHQSIGGIVPVGDILVSTDNGTIRVGASATVTGTNRIVSLGGGTLVLDNGTVVNVAAGSVTVAAADATNPRIDRIVVNNAGVYSIVAGTASAAPVPPAPGSATTVAFVTSPAAQANVLDANVADARV